MTRSLAALALSCACGLGPAWPAAAQIDPYAPEMRPDFSYPVEGINPADYGAPNLPPAWDSPPLGEGPWDFQSWEQRDYRVTVVARGLEQPRSLHFLPNGDLLVTEIEGRLRLIRDGVLRAEPVAGLPAEFYAGGLSGLRDIALHPDFERNGLIYFTYDKPVWGGLKAPAIWRGRWTGDAVADGADIFVGDDVGTGTSRLEFGADGKLYVTIGAPAVGPHEAVIRAQHSNDYAGKVLRLNDDGGIPQDNPFVDAEAYKPAIYTIGHRNQLGLAVNPWTGDLWAAEQGPNGGDEVNILGAGGNYGWPLVSDGRDYRGPYISDSATAEGMERPHIAFIPSPALGGMAFYTGDRFPGWTRNLFLAALRFGEMPRSGHLIRIVFNENWEELRREIMLFELHQRIRDVAQSPDGLLYVITGENDGAVLRLEPLPSE
jgi:glucose/arabinose dehydrogenase